MERLRKNIIELVLTDYDTGRMKKVDHAVNERYSGPADRLRQR